VPRDVLQHYAYAFLAKDGRSGKEVSLLSESGDLSLLGPIFWVQSYQSSSVEEEKTSSGFMVLDLIASNSSQINLNFSSASVFSIE
jgi:hypothetical protein